MVYARRLLDKPAVGGRFCLEEGVRPCMYLGKLRLCRMDSALVKRFDQLIRGSMDGSLCRVPHRGSHFQQRLVPHSGMTLITGSSYG